MSQMKAYNFLNPHRKIAIQHLNLCLPSNRPKHGGYNIFKGGGGPIILKGYSVWTALISEKTRNNYTNILQTPYWAETFTGWLFD